MSNQDRLVSVSDQVTISLAEIRLEVPYQPPMGRYWRIPLGWTSGKTAYAMIDAAKRRRTKP